VANNRRDLHVGIDADDRGFGQTFEDAKEKAQGLDKELAKLERQQAAQEKITTRATAAVDRFARAEDKAALAAHRLGLEAKRSAEQAEKAEVRAAAAAEAAAKGLFDEEKAARLAARADDAVERAALKAAEAHRAQARAADAAADQERQLARDAQLAAVAQRLAALKATGSVRQYNSLLEQTRANHGNLAGTAVSDFEAIATGARKATSRVEGMAAQFRELGAHATLAGIVNGLALLPALASAAGAAVSLGLGGALVGVALKAQAANKDVQQSFANTKRDIVDEFAGITAPFHGVLLNMSREADVEFSTIAPSLQRAFNEMAPATDRFAAHLIASLSQFDPFIESLGHAFARVADSLGPHMGEIINNIATGLKAITDAAAANPQALTDLIVGISKLVRYTGDSIGIMIRFKKALEAVMQVIGAAGPLGLFKFIGGLASLKNSIFGTGHSLEIGGGQFKSFADQAASGGVKLSALDQDMKTLASTTADATAKTNALTDAFARLLDPQQAVFRDTAQLQQGVGDLGAALARSGGDMGDASQAARDAKDAFGGLLGNARQFATDMVSSGQSIVEVRKQLMPYITALYQAAGSNDQARQLVDSFVRSLGMIPPAVDESGRMIGGFSGKLSTLKVPMTAARLSSLKLAEDLQTLTTSTASAEDKTNALTDAFTRLLDPELAAYQDTARLRQGMVDLAAALKKSHGALGDNSTAARAAKEAFASLLKDAEQFAQDLLRSGDSLSTVQRKLAPYILSMYKAAGANRDSRKLVDAFARAIGLVPNKKGTQLSSNAAAQKKAIEAYQHSINALHGKRVDIYQVMHLTETQAYLNKRKNLLGYARGGLVRGYAAGGEVQRLADGGPSGYVTGPGTSTSDSILTRLSNKEFVVNARATAANLPLLEAINSGRSVPVTTAAAMSGASGGSSAPIDYGRLADALTRAMRREGVGAAYLDGRAISDDVSRRMGRAADQRRRAG
jgi:hypothetical protein